MQVPGSVQIKAKTIDQARDIELTGMECLSMP
jgi:hypothetical protein